MEKLHGNNNHPNLMSQNNKSTKAKKKPIKIKYISSPMMVRANNASEFRAIVQELTGLNSKVDDVYIDDHNDDTTQSYNNSPIGELGQTTWFPNSEEEEQEEQGLLYDRSKVFDVHDPKFSTSPNSIAQFDEAQIWRSESVTESFNSSGFQYPCVFV